MTAKIKKIGLLTSGGDAPGMNACIRAVVRAADANEIEVVGVVTGYEGLIEADFVSLKSVDVSGIIQRGGTILRSARSERFKTKEWRKEAYRNIRDNEIDAIVVIGGDGTFTGADIFGNEFDVPIMGTPGTIDNDLFGTDFTIGYDTALNTALEAIDKIRDTAASHNRLFFVEVMGRDAGFIALNTGIASGAEGVLIPEHRTDVEELIHHLRVMRKSHNSAIIVVAEGDDTGGAVKLANMVKKKFDDYDTRISILGHIQRGGNPSCNDRILATRLGVAAVQSLMEGQRGAMVGLINQKIALTPFSKAIKHHQTINPQLFELAKTLSIFF